VRPWPLLAIPIITTPVSLSTLLGYFFWNGVLVYPARMAEIEIHEQNDGEVLAEAAVTSAVMAGAANANAQHALADAEQAEQAAEVAESLAEHAITETTIRPTFEETRTIVREETEAALYRLAEMLASRQSEPTPEVEVEVEAEVPDEVKPKSVEKAAKKKKMSFAERYLGLGDSEE